MILMENLTQEIQQLAKENPWLKLSEEYKTSEVISSSDPRWYCEADKVAIEEIKDKKEELLTLQLDPSPWLGRWNVSDTTQLPKLVILAFNPGAARVDDTNDAKRHKLSKEQTEEYTNIIRKNLTGKATFTEIIFSPACLQRNFYYGGKGKADKLDFWRERLYSLYEAATIKAGELPVKRDTIRTLKYEDLNSEENASVKRFFDKIMTIELCPYHSHNAGDVGGVGTYDKPHYPTSRFSADLVKLLVASGAKVVITRSKRDWQKFLGDELVKDCLTLKNPQQIYISKGNLSSNFSDSTEETWEKLVETLC